MVSDSNPQSVIFNHVLGMLIVSVLFFIFVFFQKYTLLRFAGLNEFNCRYLFSQKLQLYHCSFSYRLNYSSFMIVPQISR